ncbi:MAG: RlmE family RNA methyltransferase [Candidatus Heimdallarchaeota archaeon]|nr:RlmE family RNA methyltransferase [Candidatus Heimdallarchaeota archaeon]
MSFNRHDHYYKQAKREGYRARSSYKLLQIEKKFKIIRRGNNVLDLGAAPGSWSQVSSKFVGNKGRVIALDINPIRPFRSNNIIIIQIDMNSKFLQETLDEYIEGRINVVLSDLAENTSGNWHLDSERQIFLAELAFETAQKYLKDRGNFVTKVFRGPRIQDFENLIKPYFGKIKHWRPPATRKQSAEEYIICQNFKSNVD